MTYDFVLSDAADEERRRLVGRGLKEYNAAASPHLREAYESGTWGRALDIYLIDENGNLAGGLIGHTIWQWLDVEDLWLSAEVRRQGHGRRLMLLAEAEARRRGCRWAQVHTFSFQAREFYERLGYEHLGHIDDYPPGHAFYWLMKTLTAETGLPETRLPKS